jgi:transposase
MNRGSLPAHLPRIELVVDIEDRTCPCCRNALHRTVRIAASGSTSSRHTKYADHLPLYRQARIYLRQGITLDRSTLADWVGRAAWLLRPVHERLLMRLKSSAKLFARRDHGAGARSRPRAHQDRPALGLRPRDSMIVRDGTSGRHYPSVS